MAQPSVMSAEIVDATTQGTDQPDVPVEMTEEVEVQPDEGKGIMPEAEAPATIAILFNVTDSRRKVLVEALGNILYCKPVYKNAPTFAHVIDGYMVDKSGTLTGEYNAAYSRPSRTRASRQ